MTFLFDPNKCPVGSIPSVDFVFISECSIAPPPPPIFDCPPPLVPREPLPPPCPEFEGGTVTVGTFNENCPSESEPSRITVTETPNCKDPCRFVIDLDLKIPIPVPPCPDISGGNGKITVGAEGCITPKAKINVRTEENPNSCGSDGGCKFLIDLDLAIPIPVPPCPDINAGSSTLKVGPKGCLAPKAKIGVRKEENSSSCGGGGCQFFIDLDLAIPVPTPPCPAISAGDVVITMKNKGCGDPSGALTVTQKPKEDSCGSDAEDEACEFKIDLALQIPVPEIPCPELLIKYDDTLETPTVVQKPRETSCDDDPLAPPPCSFTISIPVPSIPCPSATGSIKVIEADEPTGSIKIGEQSGVSGCSFDIQIEIGIPIPEIPCPEVTGSVKVTETDEPTGSITITNQSGVSGCSFDIQIDIGVPVPEIPCPEVTGSVKVTETDEPTGSITITNQSGVSGCSFDIQIDIGVPGPPPCPEVTGSVKVTETDEPTGSITITQPEGSSGCSFDIQIDIGVPGPPPCPEITGSVKVTETDEPTGSITITQPAGSSGCKFEIDIDIGVPGPPPCPEVTGSIKVTETDEPTGSITITNQSGVSGCSFDIQIEVGVPPSACPEVTGSITVTTADAPTGSISITKTPSGCDYAIDIEIGIPDSSTGPKEYTGGGVIITPSGMGGGQVNVSEGGVISVDIDLSVIDCPTADASGASGALVTCDDVIACVAENISSGGGSPGPQPFTALPELDENELPRMEVGAPAVIYLLPLIIINMFSSTLFLQLFVNWFSALLISNQQLLLIIVNAVINNPVFGEALERCKNLSSESPSSDGDRDSASSDSSSSTSDSDSSSAGVGDFITSVTVDDEDVSGKTLPSGTTLSVKIVPEDPDNTDPIEPNRVHLYRLISFESWDASSGDLFDRYDVGPITDTLIPVTQENRSFELNITTDQIIQNIRSHILAELAAADENNPTLYEPCDAVVPAGRYKFYISLSPYLDNTNYETFNAGVWSKMTNYFFNIVIDQPVGGPCDPNDPPENPSDSSEPSEQSSATPEIVFRDAQGAPTPLYVFDYAENATAETTLGSVFATCGDEVVTYSIKNNVVIDIASPGSRQAAIVPVYNIDATTGAISLTSAVLNFNPNDYERTPNSRTITVEAEAAGKTKTIRVTLNETNINDRAPVFKPSPTSDFETSLYMINYMEGRTTSDVLGQVYARDPDNLSTPQFAIVGPGSQYAECATSNELEAAQFFTIDASTGEIRLSSLGAAGTTNAFMYRLDGNTKTIKVVASNGELFTCVPVYLTVTAAS